MKFHLGRKTRTTMVSACFCRVPMFCQVKHLLRSCWNQVSSHSLSCCCESANKSLGCEIMLIGVGEKIFLALHTNQWNYVDWYAEQERSWHWEKWHHVSHTNERTTAASRMVFNVNTLSVAPCEVKHLLKSGVFSFKLLLWESNRDWGYEIMLVVVYIQNNMILTNCRAKSIILMRLTTSYFAQVCMECCSAAVSACISTVTYECIVLLSVKLRICKLHC